MQEVFIDTGNVNASLSRTSGQVSSQADTAKQINDNISSLINHTSTDLSNVLYQETLTYLRIRQETVNNILGELVNGQQNQVRAVEVKYSNLDTSHLLLQLSNIGDVLRHLEIWCNDISNVSTLLVPETVSIMNSISLANNSLSISEMTLARAQMLHFLAGGDIQALEQTIIRPLVQLLQNEGSGSGDLMSGSGQILEEAMLTPQEIIPATLGEVILILRNSTIHLAQLLLQAGDIQDSAGTEILVETAERLNRYTIMTVTVAMYNYTAFLFVVQHSDPSFRARQLCYSSYFGLFFCFKYASTN